MEKNRVVVIGASNVDIKGRSVSAVYSRMKNPGRIEITAGGVGRNIAENLSRIGIPTVLLSSVGERDFVSVIKDETGRAGVDISRIRVLENVHSGIFMAVINPRGELEASISDMTALSYITPDYVVSQKEVFDDADYLVLDADIPEETLELALSVAREKGLPVCVEPVSPAKAKVMRHYLRNITLTTPNREEVEVLVERPIITSDDIKQAGMELLRRGVRYVIITLGPEGVYCASEEFSGFIPSISTLVVDSVGAGDALVAGVVAGFLWGVNFFEAVKYGISAATLTLMTSHAVNPSISRESLMEMFDKVRI